MSTLLPITNFASLEDLRNLAKLSQQDLAKLLDIHQSAVSRHEKDPDQIPAGLYRRWTALLGDLASSQGVEMENPRQEIEARAALIQSYAAVEPQVTEPTLLNNEQLTAKNFLAGVKVAGRKATIGIFGRFDSGKSRVLNTILGGNNLPTAYQPHTSVSCMIRHISDKPSWQAEDVWLFSKGFEFSKAHDQEHCLAHKLLAGGAESLKQYGTHDGAGKGAGAYAAVLYLDAPVLLGADLVDVPGYGHDGKDDERAEMGQKTVDVFIYTSTITGFMDEGDADRVGAILRNHPIPGWDEDGPLGNVYILCTHAHTVHTFDERERVMDQCSIRIAKHLEPIFQERSERAGAPIGQAELRARMFAFSADDATIRQPFVDSLVQCLSVDLPTQTLKNMDQQVRLAKAEATGECNRVIGELQMALTEREQAQAEIAAIEAAEPARLRKKAMHETKIINLIDNSSQETQAAVAALFAEKASVSAIEAMIRHRYDDKKEAQQLAASYLVTTIQQALDSALKVRASQLAEEVDGFLGNFGPAVDPSTINTTGFSFNARVAFMSGMTGLGTVGALAAWATVAAAGSNLGTYILVAQVVGWLSNIGISLGGSATVISVIAAMGGPVTVAILAGLASAMAVFSLFGDSWQTKLAKKINAGLADNKAQSKMQEAVAKYWRETKSAFTAATEKTEESYMAYLMNLKTMAFSTQREELERALSDAKAMRDFFAGMPWKAMT